MKRTDKPKKPGTSSASGGSQSDLRRYKARVNAAKKAGTLSTKQAQSLKRTANSLAGKSGNLTKKDRGALRTSSSVKLNGKPGTPKPYRPKAK